MAFVPVPTPETQPFWDGTRHGTLRVQWCRDCERFFFYPRPFCRHCFSRRIEWRPVRGRGRLHTFTVSYRGGRQAPFDPPFVIAIVELDEGPRLMSNIIDVDPDPSRLKCGMRVEVVFQRVSDEITVARFRPAMET